MRIWILVIISVIIIPAGMTYSQDSLFINYQQQVTDIDEITPVNVKNSHKEKRENNSVIIEKYVNETDVIREKMKEPEKDKKIGTVEVKKIKELIHPVHRKEKTVVNPIQKIVNKYMDFVSVFRENIKFQGFWDKYAVINLNQSASLQPLPSVHIYGNYNLNCLVPVKESKNYVKSFALYGAAMILVDNGMKLFTDKDELIPSIVEYVSKNVLTFLFKKSFDTINGNENLGFDSHFYKVTFTF